MASSKLFLGFLALFVFTFSNFVSGTLASDSDSAASVIERAEDVMAWAYEAVLEAERAGADVEDLTGQLNWAGELLARARFQYRMENFGSAVGLADHCYETSSGVLVEAGRLRNLAVEEGVRLFWLTIVGSMVSVAIIVYGSFLGWRVFVRHYYRKILRMRPEVALSES